MYFEGLSFWKSNSRRIFAVPKEKPKEVVDLVTEDMDLKTTLTNLLTNVKGIQI